MLPLRLWHRVQCHLDFFVCQVEKFEAGSQWLASESSSSHFNWGSIWAAILLLVLLSWGPHICISFWGLLVPCYLLQEQWVLLPLPWAQIQGGTGGRVPPTFFQVGDTISNVPPTFFFLSARILNKIRCGNNVARRKVCAVKITAILIELHWLHIRNPYWRSV